MIGQNSNNRASGISAKECDAGIPIVGRTSANGQYEIIKVAADGTIVTNAGASPIPDSTTPYLLQPAVNPITIPGLMPPDVLMCTQQITGIINEGVYRVNPTIIFDGAISGSVNMALVKQSSVVGGYFIGLVPFVDPVALSTAFIASGGLAFYWHNTAIVGLGTNSVIAYNRNNSQTIFLETGDYYLCVWNDSGVNVLSPGNLLVGALEFSKV